MSNRKKRSDSVEVTSAAFQAAMAGPLRPPEYLSLPPEAVPFWDAIVTTKARDSWTPHDMMVAANLARIYAEIEKLSAIVRVEGRVESTQHGDKVSANHKALADLISQSINLARAVQVHSRATHGESSHQVKRNDAYRQAQRIVDNGMDELLAKAH